ncbi:MAG: hypothetical protein FWD43_01030 [Coriobacteriia bacterium]|nr:hypothetical protein [Coriobacteriia bacterium]
MDDINDQPKPEKQPLQAWLTFAVFILIIGGFFLVNLVAPKPEILISERRLPAKLPSFDADSVLSTEFMEGFEDYAADNFIFREALRTLRAITVFNVFQMGDKDGLYQGAVGAGKIEPIKTESVLAWAAKMERLQADLASQHDGLKFFYAVIPDKSLYDARSLPGYDPVVLASLLEGRLKAYTSIDLTGALQASDFYRTDLHWDQALLGQRSGDVLDVLARALGCQSRLTYDFVVRDAGEFTGVFPGQLALPMAPDQLRYLTNPVLDKVVVSYLDPRTGEFVKGPVYDLEAADGRDRYDLFLRGPQPVVVIENPSATTDRELYIFRDSFTSSLAPLLASGYARVTLIDLRYIDYRILPQYVDFAPNSDILLLYGSQILNNPTILLIQ